MKIRITLFIFLSCSAILFSQNKKSIYKPIESDCNKAININIAKSTVYGITVPPDGYGAIQEINNSNNKFLFTEEHNSAWYRLNINANGELCFDIIPQDSTNDYDFILFPYSDSTTCPQIIANQLKPLRANLARNNFKVKSKTGLSISSKSELVNQGIGNPYSKAIQVKKGEKYLLVLDNVYPNGKGHTINFNFMKAVELTATVTDSANKPIVAEISLTDNKGNIVGQTHSNKTGTYKIKTSLIENQDYGLTIMSDSLFFIGTKTINTNQLKNGSSFIDIKTVLPKLKGGNKYNLGNMNFYGDSDELLPESYPSIEALNKLMKKNKKMKIQIEGHVNNPQGKYETSKSDLDLSEKRAKTVFNYLSNKGIDEKRLSALGLGAKYMLFPTPQNEAEMHANRRVEIKVISIN